MGKLAGDAVSDAAGSVFSFVLDPIFRVFWTGGLAILRAAFDLADQFSIFTVSKTSGPLAVLWPLMLWLSGVLALGLFFWQIITVMLAGGAGFRRLVTGPFAYGIALSVTVGMVAAFLSAADGLTEIILRTGLRAGNFHDALNVSGIGDALSDGVKAVVLLLAAVFGTIPAGLIFAVEMVFREAAIYLLVLSVPLVAAGLLSNVTARWFWTTVRWLLAAIAMKPVLALTLVMGFGMLGGAQGLSGLLSAIAVLLVSIFTPLVLFKLFAFVDPGSDVGAGMRGELSRLGLSPHGMPKQLKNLGGGSSGAGGSGDGDGGDGGEDGGGGSEEQEQANAERFDNATAELGDTPGAGGGSGGGTGGKEAASGAGAGGGGNQDGGSGSGADGGGAGADGDGGGSGAMPAGQDAGQETASQDSGGLSAMGPSPAVPGADVTPGMPELPDGGSMGGAPTGADGNGDEGGSGGGSGEGGPGEIGEAGAGGAAGVVV